MKKPPFRDSNVVTIKCALGLEWDIKEARATKYGFDLYYGRRANPGHYEAGGPYRLIYTNELKAFWEQCALRYDGTIFDLPAGRTTLKRARVALGFNWDKDSQKFWRKHKEDMKTLTPRAFEKKHSDRDLTGRRMSAWRLRIIGGKARQSDWWKTPEVLKLLLSEEKSLNQVRAELGEKISTSHAFRLRLKAKRAYGMSSGNVAPIPAGVEQPQLLP
jgi:hypothetical protein